MKAALVIALLCGSARAEPETFDARVLKLEVAGDAIILTAAMGSDQGIGRDWRGSLRDGKHHDIGGGEVILIRVDKRTTVVKSHLTLDQAHAGPFYVHFSPPK